MDLSQRLDVLEQRINTLEKENALLRSHASQIVTLDLDAVDRDQRIQQLSGKTCVLGTRVDGLLHTVQSHGYQLRDLNELVQRHRLRIAGMRSRLQAYVERQNTNTRLIGALRELAMTP